MEIEKRNEDVDAPAARKQWVTKDDELPTVATRGAAERNNGSNTRAE